MGTAPDRYDPNHDGDQSQGIIPACGVLQVFQNEPQAPKPAASKGEKKSSSSGFSLPTPSFSLDPGSIAIPGILLSDPSILYTKAGCGERDCGP